MVSEFDFQCINSRKLILITKVNENFSSKSKLNQNVCMLVSPSAIANWTHRTWANFNILNYLYSVALWVSSIESVVRGYWLLSHSKIYSIDLKWILDPWTTNVSDKMAEMRKTTNAQETWVQWCTLHCCFDFRLLVLWTKFETLNRRRASFRLRLSLGHRFRFTLSILHQLLIMTLFFTLKALAAWKLFKKMRKVVCWPIHEDCVACGYIQKCQSDLFKIHTHNTIE